MTYAMEQLTADLQAVERAQATGELERIQLPARIPANCLEVLPEVRQFLAEVRDHRARTASVNVGQY